MIIDDLFECNFCQTVFFCPDSLKEHVADTHFVDKGIKCTECIKSFISTEKLDLHFLEHKKKKGRRSCHECPVCSKPFSTKSNAVRHIASHNNKAIQPFKDQLGPTSEKPAEKQEKVAFDLVPENTALEQRYSLRKRNVRNYDEDLNDLNFLTPALITKQILKPAKTQDVTEVDIVRESTASENVNIRSVGRVPIIKQEPGEPNIKYEPDEPGILKIANVFTITSVPVTETLEILNSLYRSPTEFLEKNMVPETVNDIVEKNTASEKIYSFRERRVQTNDEGLPKLDLPNPANITEQNLKPTEKQDILTCDICSTVFFSMESLEKHVVDIHVVDKEFNCTECTKSFLTPDELDSHMAEHEKEEEVEGCFKCPICSRVLANRRNGLKHVITHDVEKPYKCQSCPKSFGRKPSLTHHEMNKHGRDKKFKCAQCPKSFTREYMLKLHLGSHSQTKEREEVKSDWPFNDEARQGGYKCPICFRILSSRHHAKRHLITHDAVKPHKCKLCPRTFSRAEHLRAHEMNQHGKEKQFKCSECNKSFARNEDLKDHIKTHSKFKNIVCEHCGGRYKTISCLRQHRKYCKWTRTENIHYDYTCSICGKGFIQKGNLRIHMVIHSDDRKFKCHLCSVTYKGKIELNNHLKKKHRKHL